jgi:hypothetical protein
LFCFGCEIIVLESCKTKGRKGKRKFKRCAAERNNERKERKRRQKRGADRERGTEGERRINEGTQTREEEDKHKNGIAHERKREQREREKSSNGRKSRTKTSNKKQTKHGRRKPDGRTGGRRNSRQWAWGDSRDPKRWWNTNQQKGVETAGEGC